MNTGYPILLFPSPATATRSKMGGGGGKPHLPTADVNAVRLGPKFDALKSSLENRRMHLQQEAEGVNPEDVLVLETAGRIEDFIYAVQHVEGLEWLLEEDFDGKPDDVFYEEKDGVRIDKDLSSRLYLISTNEQALNQIISLYKLFSDHSGPGLERGYGKFKDVFEQLRDIRFWSYKDRIDGNDFFEKWLRNNETFPENRITFQIELWYRDSKIRREAAQRVVEELVSVAGGSVLSCCTIEEIRYHALLVEVQADKLREIVNNVEDGSLIKCRDIMYFKQMPQTMFGVNEDEDSGGMTAIPEDAPVPTGEPIVALLDGYPLANHAKLSGRMIIEDPDDFASHYQVKNRIHGTEMASLIIHGDLSCPGETLDTPLYVHPIMIPDSEGLEQMPEKILPVDLVHRAVKRMLVGENGETPTAPHVKIINFSIGDRARMFTRTMSPMARLLDWLSYEYGVLFIISAGNTYVTFPMGCNIVDFKRKDQEEISKFVTEELLKRRMELRLLSPAESINNLTVGSVHQDAFTSTMLYPNQVNPYACLHPTTYTPFGGGLKKSIKPELVYDGGRQILKEASRDFTALEPLMSQRAPGIQTAYPDDTLNKTSYSRGTSSSTALVTRQAYRCYQELNEILVLNNLSNSHIHLLIKALTIHGCSWETIGDNIDAYLPSNISKQEAKDIKRQWIGYGYPNIEHSLLCTPQRVTVLGYGELGKEDAHIYRLPLPPSLASKINKRRLTITLAWMSPINPQSQRYRKARLWAETTDNKKIVANKVELVDNKAVRRGTVQHEVFEGNNAYAFQDGDHLGIKVNCSEDAGGLVERVKYAIAVSLELAEAIEMDLFSESLYEEVRNRLRVPIAIAASTIV